MDALLRHAGQILETAAEAQGAEGPDHPSEYLIAVLRVGSIRMFADSGGWSLPALAAEYGASAVYRVTRRTSSVRVEAWSAVAPACSRANCPLSMPAEQLRQP
jgi:hypothetical protein